MPTELKFSDTRKALEKLQDDAFVRSINPNGLKASVAKTYMYEVDKLMALTSSSSMSRMVKDVDTLIDFIENYKYTTKKGEIPWADNSKKAKYTAIHALMKYGIVKLPKAAIDKYVAKEQLYSAKHEQVKALSMPTKKTVENDLSWAKVRQAYDKLAADAYASYKHVFAAMYVLVPPRRLTEYKDLFIYNRAPRNSKHPNYVVISQKYGESTIHISEYKTNKSYKVFERKLPETLVDIIKDSLKNKPRKTLIVTPKGRVFKNESSMSKGLSNIFKEIIGVPLSVQELRRLYIDEHFPKLNSHGERKELAAWMGHSMETQSAYRMDNRESIAENNDDISVSSDVDNDEPLPLVDDNNSDIKTRIVASIEALKEKMIRELDEFKTKVLELI